MKKRLTAGLLAVCLLTGLTGCSSDQLTEQVTDKLLSSDDGIAFAVDKPVKDDSMTLTVRSITLSDAVYAPLTTDSEGAYTAYYTEDGTGKEQDADKDSVYLDCTADVKNTGDQALDLEDDLFFYAITGGKGYGDYMAFTEAQDNIKQIAAFDQLHGGITTCTCDRINGGDELGGFDGEHRAALRFHRAADGQSALCDRELCKGYAVNILCGRQHEGDIHPAARHPVQRAHDNGFHQPPRHTAAGIRHGLTEHRIDSRRNQRNRASGIRCRRHVPRFTAYGFVLSVRRRRVLSAPTIDIKTSFNCTQNKSTSSGKYRF